LSRARRIADRSAVKPFEWLRSKPAPEPTPPPPPEEPPPVEPAPLPPPPPPAVDPAIEHQQHLAALERDAFAKGFAQGEKAGMEAAAKRGEAMLRRLTQTLDEMTTLRAQMIRETEQQMVSLALAVARRIIHREVSLDRDLLIAIARVALDRLGESATVSVHLNPEDYAATEAARTREWEGTQVTVMADARVPRGGCRIESDFGALDAGIDAQIQELAHALLGDEGSKDA
jgi:flagellar assembly protein FliH